MKTMKTKYEQQANNFLKSTNTIIDVRYLKNGKHFESDTDVRDIYKITIKRGQSIFKFNFGQSINGTIKKQKPTNYDILACLTKYDVGALEDFCSEFGYDLDSKTTKKTYNAVCKEFDNVCKMWTDAEIQILQDIN